MLIALSSQVRKRQNEFGAKTRHLSRMQEAGLPVPPFIALPVSLVERLAKSDTKTLMDTIVDEITKNLPVARYAVRSSALVEDAEQQSFAGQFLTKIDQSAEQLAQAISEVIVQATEYLKKEGAFSILIQEYILADFSGVTFSRHPSGGREMVTEYHKGIGEELVGGKIQPERLSFYWHEHPKEMSLPWEKGIQLFKEIESLFRTPQDIEWCIRSGHWYILQSRPITSLTETQYLESLYLDLVLPKDEKFLYEKTEISEIAPRPTPATMSLLSMIYAQGGVVEQGYQKYGVRYLANDFFKIVGNELYVDREAELRTLLPSYTYFHGNNIRVGSRRLSGMLTSIRNTAALQKISPQDQLETIIGTMEKKLNTTLSESSSLQEGIQDFLMHYAFIVEVNVLAAKSIKKLEKAMFGHPTTTAAVLGSKVGDTTKTLPTLSILTERLQGNALELSDIAPFFHSLTEEIAAPDVQNWWMSLSESNRTQFSPLITEAKAYNHLREYGRVLTVKLVNTVRRSLEKAAHTIHIKSELIFFGTLPEWIDGSISEELLQKRKEDYHKFSSFQLPARLVYTPLTVSSAEPVGVSVGEATGTLVTLDTVDTIQGKKILWTPVLSPDLIQYFDRIEGILSEQGGILSHLAIIAREQHLPVIVHWNPKQFNRDIGQMIHMNGATGTVVLH